MLTYIILLYKSLNVVFIDIDENFLPKYGLSKKYLNFNKVMNLKY